MTSEGPVEMQDGEDDRLWPLRRGSGLKKKNLFQDRAFLCNPDYHGTHSVHQADLEEKDLPASAS